MKIREKTIIVLSAASISLVLVMLAALYLVVAPTFKNLENKELAKNIDRAVKELHNDSKHMASTARDWSVWNDTYTYMAGTNPDFPDANTDPETMANLKLGLMVFIDREGKPFFTKQVDPEKALEIDPDAVAVGKLVEIIGAKPGKHLEGFFVSRETPYTFAAHQIFKNDGSGPSVGVLAIAHPLDVKYADNLSRQLNLAINIKPVRPEFENRIGKLAPLNYNGITTFLDDEEENTVSGYTLLEDPTSKPSIALEVSVPRDIYKGGLTSIMYAALAMIVFGTLFVILMIAVLDKSLLKRVASMTERLSPAAGGAKADLGEKVNDEIGILANAIGDAIDAQEERATKYREREHHKELALAGGDIGHWEYNIVTGKAFFSSRFNTMLGYGENELANSWDTWETIIHPDEKLKVLAKFDEALSMKSPQWDMEMRLLTKTGEYRHVHSRGKVVLADEKGHAKVIAGTHMDINDIVSARERKSRHEEQVRQTQKMQALATLSGGIAHNFNNILAAIMGYIEIVIDELPEGSQNRDNLKEALKASIRAGELVRQMLIFSHAREKFNETFELCRHVEEAFRFLREAVPTSIEMVSSCPDVSIIVNCDSYQLREAIINICNNAVESMNPETGRLIIAVSAEKGEHTGFETTSPDRAVITITDNGCGMTKEVRENAFNPYFTTKGDIARVGLGLAVVHSIITDLGGTIGIESEVGKGTEVKIKIPALIGVAEDERKWPREMSGRERILFVEDERLLADIAKQYFSKLGYQLTIALDPRKALQLFDTAPDSFDIVITDMVMPKITGIELSREIHRKKPSVPIILCSGYLDIVDDAERKQAGIVEMLRKPVSLPELARRMRRLFDERQAETGSFSIPGK